MTDIEPVAAPGMRVTMLLADHAQSAEGKLYILGGGWSVTGPQPGPMAIAMKIDVPWDQTNTKHVWHLALEQADGAAVELPTPEGPQNVVLSGEFEVGRPVGLAKGTPIDVPVALNLGPMPLPPGQRYSWRLSIDSERREDWHLDFDVRPAEQVVQ